MYTGQYLRRKAAAEYPKSKYGFGAFRTLAKLATIGGGPEYRMAGRLPVYTPKALDQWALCKIGAPVRSTSEVKANRSNTPATKTCAGV
jgi:hypothetical protein